MLLDNHHRQITYLRLSVTDRCNLRCSYCLPSSVQFQPAAKLLRDEEILRLISLLASEGVSKIRITGGEPFTRRGLTSLLKRMSAVNGIETLGITTNGTLALPHLQALADMGIRDINLSLDSLQKDRFFQITGRNSFQLVWKTIEKCLDLKLRVKINMVVMAGVNTDEIRDFALLAALYPVSVRFIEEMPFDGKSAPEKHSSWDYRRIRRELSAGMELRETPRHPENTAINYTVRGYPGSIGIIPAYSRTFCGTCNRLRITSTGAIRTCLYGEHVMNIRDLIRSGASDEEVLRSLRTALGNRHANGWDAAAARHSSLLETMSSIGG